MLGFSRGLFACAVLMAPALLATHEAGAASAPPFQTLYSFPASAPNPAGGLYRDNKGVLYGTTISGGPTSVDCTEGCGTIFMLKPPQNKKGAWTRTTLHSLTFTEGKSSYSSLTPNKDGELFGAASEGGANDLGSIFKLTPPSTPAGAWGFEVIHSLAAGEIGGGVYGDLIVDKAGAVYGIAGDGGANGGGTVFRLSPPTQANPNWTVKVLYAFDAGGATGKAGYGGLVADKDGTLYGVTSAGGANGFGVIFRLTPPALPAGNWTFRNLYDFTGGTGGGATPYGSLVLSKGVLYGTTAGGGIVDAECDSLGLNGCGTIYSLQLPAIPSGNPTFKILHKMNAPTDGGAPQTGLTIDNKGALLGVNYLVGTGGQGTLFKLTPPAKKQINWTFTVLHPFSAQPDGDDPTGVILRISNGTLYGTTQYGGENDKGMAFSYKP